MEETYVSANDSLHEEKISFQTITPIEASEIREILTKYHSTSPVEHQLQQAILKINTLLREAAQQGLYVLKNFKLSSTGPLWPQIIDQVVKLYQKSGFIVICYQHHGSALSDTLSFQLTPPPTSAPI
jgi:hypothetical protein